MRRRQPRGPGEQSGGSFGGARVGNQWVSQNYSRGILGASLVG